MAGGGRQNADDVLVLALACGATVENAALKAGLSPRTAHRRLANPQFRQQLNQIRADMVQRAAHCLRPRRWRRSRRSWPFRTIPLRPRCVRAARAILELGTKLREASEWEARLTALEQRMTPGGGSVTSKL